MFCDYAHTHTNTQGVTGEWILLPQNETLSTQKVCALWNANEAIRELKIWQLRHTTCSNMETKQTHGESGAGWDVGSIESKYSPPSPDIETLTISLQQHGTVVNCRGLETPAALQTWGRRGESQWRWPFVAWLPVLHLLSKSAPDILSSQTPQNALNERYDIQHNWHLIGGSSVQPSFVVCTSTETAWFICMATHFMLLLLIIYLSLWEQLWANK